MLLINLWTSNRFFYEYYKKNCKFFHFVLFQKRKYCICIGEKWEALRTNHQNLTTKLLILSIFAEVCLKTVLNEENVYLPNYANLNPHELHYRRLKMLFSVVVEDKLKNSKRKISQTDFHELFDRGNKKILQRLVQCWNTDIINYWVFESFVNMCSFAWLCCWERRDTRFYSSVAALSDCFGTGGAIDMSSLLCGRPSLQSWKSSSGRNGQGP